MPRDWQLFRYDILTKEGFTPEEASLIRHVKISSQAIKRLRKQRKIMLEFMTLNEALNIIRKNNSEVLTWDQLRRILYPQKYKVV